jgi:hypothetical protein
MINILYYMLETPLFSIPCYNIDIIGGLKDNQQETKVLIV